MGNCLGLLIAKSWIYTSLFSKRIQKVTRFLISFQSSVGVKHPDGSLFIQLLERWSSKESIGAALKKDKQALYPRLVVNEMKCSKLFLPSPQLDEQTVYRAYWLNCFPASLSFLPVVKCLQNLYVETSNIEVDSWRKS